MINDTLSNMCLALFQERVIEKGLIVSENTEEVKREKRALLQNM